MAEGTRTAVSGRTPDASPPHVVIIGGGFAGLYAARELAGAAVRVTLIDRRNHHLFQPLLYQVATAALAAPDVAAPIRRILRKQSNATVLLGEVGSLDPDGRSVALADGQRIGYDYLVLAAGTETSYFGNDDWKRHAPGLKSIGDAFEIRDRVLMAFERAERESDAERRARDLRFIVVGAGPTGVELAGALREIATKTLASDFRNIATDQAEVLLIDATGRVLPSFPEPLSRGAHEELERLGVVIRTGVRVKQIDDGGVQLESGERIASRAVLWAAGVVPSPLAEGLGGERTEDGRVLVDDDLSLPGHPELFVAGDLAAVRSDNGEWVPGMAPGAIQMGRHAARTILRDLERQPRQPFRYRHRGLLATVGRSHAVAEVAGRHFSGLMAWLLWVFVHIYWLIGFRERITVLFEWAWAWLTWQRSARVIVSAPPDLPGSNGDSGGAEDGVQPSEGGG